MDAPAGGSEPPAAAAAAAAAPEGSDAGQQCYNDEFMMFVFKVEMCKRVDKHDREKCPYAHPGELARRRHPSLYRALPCPEARARRICPRLENCNCSHSTFEFWLHPDRHKTFMCERGAGCTRPVCFFAHRSDELRELPQGLQRTMPAPKPPSTAGAESSLPSSSAVHAHSSSSSSNWHERGRAGGSGAHVVWQPGGRGGGGQHAAGWLAQQPQYPAPLQGGEGLVAWGAGSSSGGGAPGQPLLMPAVWAGAGMQQQQLQYPYQPIPGSSGGQQQQQLAPGLYVPHQQQQQAGPLAQQVLVGYQQLPDAAHHPGGMVMLRPGLQQGATVAVIPAGPSAWSGGGLAMGPDDAPTLEALCAAVNRSVVLQAPAPQPGAHGLLLEPYHPAAAAAAGAAPHPAAEQQQLPVLSVAGAPSLAPPVQQPGAQQAQAQLLAGPPMVVMMPPADDGSQAAWGALPQPAA